jgi:hypothetical protein
VRQTLIYAGNLRADIVQRILQSAQQVQNLFVVLFAHAAT